MEALACALEWRDETTLAAQEAAVLVAAEEAALAGSGGIANAGVGGSIGTSSKVSHVSLVAEGVLQGGTQEGAGEQRRTGLNVDVGTVTRCAEDMLRCSCVILDAISGRERESEGGFEGVDNDLQQERMSPPPMQMLRRRKDREATQTLAASMGAHFIEHDGARALAIVIRSQAHAAASVAAVVASECVHCAAAMLRTAQWQHATVVAEEAVQQPDSGSKPGGDAELARARPAAAKAAAEVGRGEGRLGVVAKAFDTFGVLQAVLVHVQRRCVERDPSEAVVGHWHWAAEAVVSGSNAVEMRLGQVEVVAAALVLFLAMAESGYNPPM